MTPNLEEAKKLLPNLIKGIEGNLHRWLHPDFGPAEDHIIPAFEVFIEFMKETRAFVERICEAAGIIVLTDAEELAAYEKTLVDDDNVIAVEAVGLMIHGAVAGYIAKLDKKSE